MFYKQRPEPVEVRLHAGLEASYKQITYCTTEIGKGYLYQLGLNE
jgi:hypothetical protein